MDTVTLNVGGTRFTTALSTLQAVPGSRLERLQSTTQANNANSADFYFFDRNPKVFEGVLDFYRTGQLHFPRDLCGGVVRRELEFWEISLDSISDCCYTTICNYDDSKANMVKLKIAFEKNELQYSDEQLRNNRLNWLRDQVWRFMNFPKSSKPALIYSAIYTVWLILPILTSVLSTHPDCRDPKYPNVRNTSQNGTRLSFQQLMLLKTGNPKLALVVSTTTTPGLWYTEAVCTLLFLLEFLLRLACCPNFLGLLRSPLNYVDLAVLCSSLAIFVIDVSDSYDRDNEDLSRFSMVCRILMVLRTFRLINLTRHIGGLRVLILATTASLKELFLLLVSFLSVAVLFATVVYYAEFEQPETFLHIPFAIWWSVVTMTTVGYGDLTPSTLTGYVSGSLCAVTGVLLISMPIAVIASNFAEFYHLNKIRTQKEMLSRAKPESSDNGKDSKSVKKNKVGCVTCNAETADIIKC